MTKLGAKVGAKVRAGVRGGGVRGGPLASSPLSRYCNASLVVPLAP